MIDRDICKSCRKMRWGDATLSGDDDYRWSCPAALMAETPRSWKVKADEATPPEGCYKMMEQGIAAALRDKTNA
jgi:hypothetical protein